jgi:hypothetical protein
MVGGYRAQGLVDLLEIQLSEKTDSLLANDLGPLRVLALDSGSLRNLDLLRRRASTPLHRSPCTQLRRRASTPQPTPRALGDVRAMPRC